MFALRRLLVWLAACVLCALPNGARADDKDRATLLEENDSLYFNSDKHYTQGLRISDLRPDLAPDSVWQRPFAWLGNLAPIFLPNGGPSAPNRRYALFLGQSLFTPKNLRQKPPDPRDRPYAGWAYLGASLLQADDRILDFDAHLVCGALQLQLALAQG